MKLEFYQTPETFISNQISYPKIYEALTIFANNPTEKDWTAI